MLPDVNPPQYLFTNHILYSQGTAYFEDKTHSFSENFFESETILITLQIRQLRQKANKPIWPHLLSCIRSRRHTAGPITCAPWAGHPASPSLSRLVHRMRELEGLAHLSESCPFPQIDVTCVGHGGHQLALPAQKLAFFFFFFFFLVPVVSVPVGNCLLLGAPVQVPRQRRTGHVNGCIPASHWGAVVTQIKMKLSLSKTHPRPPQGMGELKLPLTRDARGPSLGSAGREIS